MIEKLVNSIQEADYVLVGIGEEWGCSFDKMIEDKSFYNAYSKLHTDEEREKYVPFLQCNYLKEIHSDELKMAYSNLEKLVCDKKYFIVSMNKDRYPAFAGLKRENMVFPCGGYEMLQCDNGCENSLVDASSIENEVMNVFEHAIDFSEIEYPLCEKCGDQMVFNNIEAKKYLEAGYLTDWEHYMKWLQNTINRKLCVLELGVSMRYPSVIRWPFEKTVYYNQKSELYRINHSLWQCTENIADRSMGIKENSVSFLANMFV